MVVANKYPEAILAAYRAEITDIDDGSTVITVALMDDNHSFSNADDSWDDVSANEITDSDYTDTEDIANVSWSRSGSTVTFDGDDVVWSDVTISADHAVVYDDTPASDADKKLLVSIDFEGTEESEDGDFTISWDADGIFDIEANA